MRRGWKILLNALKIYSLALTSWALALLVVRSRRRPLRYSLEINSPSKKNLNPPLSLWTSPPSDKSQGNTNKYYQQVHRGFFQNFPWVWAILSGYSQNKTKTLTSGKLITYRVSSRGSGFEHLTVKIDHWNHWRPCFFTAVCGVSNQVSCFLCLY